MLTDIDSDIFVLFDEREQETAKTEISTANNSLAIAASSFRLFLDSDGVFDPANHVSVRYHADKRGEVERLGFWLYSFEREYGLRTARRCLS